MENLTNAIAACRSLGRRQVQEYAHGEERPIGGYLAVSAAYGAGVATVVCTARAAGRSAPQSLGARDLFLLTVATHKLSRLVAKDSVTSPFRVPFTRFHATSGPSELDEEVRGGGLRHAVGELVTCPFCLGPWVATALLATYAFSPATARTVCSGLTAVAGSDFLHYAYVALQQEVERQ